MKHDQLERTIVVMMVIWEEEMEGSTTDMEYVVGVKVEGKV